MHSHYSCSYPPRPLHPHPKEPPATHKQSHTCVQWDSSVIRTPDSWLNGREFESLQEQRANFLLQGQLSVLTLISVSVPPPYYCSSTKKIPNILPKVQVTTKHACTLRMWLCMKWHGAWLYGVHRTRRDGTSHVSAVSTPPVQWKLRNKCVIKS